METLCERRKETYAGRNVLGKKNSSKNKARIKWIALDYSKKSKRRLKIIKKFHIKLAKKSYIKSDSREARCISDNDNDDRYFFKDNRHDTVFVPKRNVKQKREWRFKSTKNLKQ